MKISKALALGFLATSFYAAAASALMPAPDNSKRSCEAARHCVVVHAPCGGWDVVNRKYLKDAKEYYGELEATVRCAAKIERGIAPEPRCEAGLCVITQEENHE